MFLLAGLGNPGNQYADNRHNVGFMAIDAIACEYNFADFSSRHHAEVSKGCIGPHDVLLLKPQTFMNRSGIAVAEAARFYKIPLQHIWVLYDELDLVPCKLRIKRGGSSGGHNGIKSIDAHLGKDYGRLRIGIGRPEHTSQVTSYVLGDFSAEERMDVDTTLGRLAKEIPALLEGRDDLVMNRLTQKD